MLSALMVTAVLACKPYQPTPPPVSTLACEGADQVRRDFNGVEQGRWHDAPACTRVACEGSDFVRRDLAGLQVERWTWAPQCMVTRCEGSDFVRRDSRGLELERWSNASVCPARPVRLTSDPPLRFGLSSRG